MSKPKINVAKDKMDEAVAEMEEKSHIDDDIESINWDGKIPICFELAANELTSFETPSPVYVLASRVSYLLNPLITSKVESHFKRHTPLTNPRLWLEYKGKPLRWYLPFS